MNDREARRDKRHISAYAVLSQTSLNQRRPCRDQQNTIFLWMISKCSGENSKPEHCRFFQMLHTDKRGIITERNFTKENRTSREEVTLWADDPAGRRSWATLRARKDEPLVKRVSVQESSHRPSNPTDPVVQH